MMKGYQGGWVSALFDAATAPVQTKAKASNTKASVAKPAMASKQLKHA